MYPAGADLEGGQGVQTPLENRKAIRYLSHTGPDPLTNQNATNRGFNVGPLFVSSLP